MNRIPISLIFAVLGSIFLSACEPPKQERVRGQKKAAEGPSETDIDPLKKENEELKRQLEELEAKRKEEQEALERERAEEEEAQKKRDEEAEKAAEARDFVAYCENLDASAPDKTEQARTIELLKVLLVKDQNASCQQIKDAALAFDHLKLNSCKPDASRDEKIRDVTPFAYLPWLRSLQLECHDLVTIEPLKEMEYLAVLWVSFNPRLKVEGPHLPPALKDVAVQGVLSTNELERDGLHIFTGLAANP